MQQRLNSLINPYVLSMGTRHPDYIYIKYHIYKESMLQRKYEEIESKVSGFNLVNGLDLSHMMRA